jgi:hypothetical protein
MEAKKSGDIDKCISITARVLNSAENSSAAEVEAEAG